MYSISKKSIALIGKILFIFFQYLLTSDTHATNIIELRCSYTYSGTSSEKEIWRDSDGIQTHAKIPVENKSQGKGVDFLKFTIDGKYLKLETGNYIYSTKDSENKFGDWKKNDVAIKIENLSNENIFRVIAKVKINKYGDTDVSEMIFVDRISGDFMKSTDYFAATGSIDKNSPLNITTRTISNYESKGLCEKFNRKF